MKKQKQQPKEQPQETYQGGNIIFKSKKKITNSSLKSDRGVFFR